MAEQLLLHRPDVVAVFDQVRREAVAEGAADGHLLNTETLTAFFTALCRSVSEE